MAGGLNTYLYAEANPLKFIDPTGEAAVATALCFIPGVGWVSCAGAAAATGVAATVWWAMNSAGGGSGTQEGTGEQCDTKNDKNCKLHSQNKIGLPPGKIRCNYKGYGGFITRIIDGDSCPNEVDWVPGEHTF